MVRGNVYCKAVIVSNNINVLMLNQVYKCMRIFLSFIKYYDDGELSLLWAQSICLGDILFSAFCPKAAVNALDYQYRHFIYKI